MTTPQTLPVKSIVLSGTNPRKHFNPAALAELQASIVKHGILQPILVRPFVADADESPAAKALNIGKRGQAAARGETLPAYKLVAGERRLRAAISAGLKEVPVVIRDLDDKAALEVQVIENLQRADLHPIEEAEGYEKLMSAHGYSAEDLAAKVGKSKAYIYARLKLTALCKEVRNALWDDRINHSVGLLIARIPDADLQVKALKEVSGAPYNRPMPEKEARRHIQENYMLRLKDAPFDTRDKDLVPSAGPCATCPKRTGNQKELFPDVQSGDVCTDPVCFAQKKDATNQAKLAAHAAAGHPVLTPAESKKIFYDRGGLNTDAYVELDNRCRELGYTWDKNWRETLGKQCPPPILAVDPEGELHELVTAAEARTALKATGRKPRQDSGQASYTREQRNREKRKRLLTQAAHHAAGQLLPKLTAPVLKAKDPKHARLWALIARAAYDCTDIDTHAFVAKRRGLVKSQTEARSALEKLLKTTTEASALVELTIELLLCSRWNGNHWNACWSARYKELAKLAKVNLAACEKQTAAKPKQSKIAKRKS